MKSTQYPVLLVDGNNLLYRATYGFPARILNRRKQDITPLFGFFALLRIAFKEIGYPLHFVIFFDGERCLESRRLQNSSYKENRLNNPQNPYAALPQIMISLQKMKLHVFVDEFTEADELIGQFIGQMRSSKFYIMSTDKDFYQLVSEKVVILNTTRKSGERIITEDHIKNKFGVSPKMWCDFRALMGDPADNIKGIFGVGPKTSLKLLGLNEELLNETLFNQYHVRYESFLKDRELIRFQASSISREFDVGYVIKDFLSPAKVIEFLGLWD